MLYTTLDPDPESSSGTRAKSRRQLFRSVSSGETIFVGYRSHVSQTVSQNKTLRYLNESGSQNCLSLSFTMTIDALHSTSKTITVGPKFDKWMF